jgi:uncharacterized protein YdaU (DUF1376 family)
VVPIVNTCPNKGHTVAKERIPYFRFYPTDFMGGVRGMSAQEIGLYVMLLCRMYEENGPIEDHALKLSTYCGMRQATFEKTLQKLVDLGKIERHNGRLFNDRARIEISNRANDLEIAIRAGKASAEKRQIKQGQDATPVQRSFNHADTDTEVKETEPKGSVKKTRRKPEVDLPEGWVPSDRNIQDAIDKGLSEREIQDEADRFRNHHYSKQSRFRDWDAAWRTWCSNALRYRKGGGVAGSAGAGYGGQRSSLAGIVARRRIEGR